MADLFGISKYPKKLDPALAGFSDQELRDRVPGLPDWVTDEEVSAELAQRQLNRKLASST